MNIGMLWLDDDGRRSLDEKVQRAADYYREKYGCVPELCFISAKMGVAELKVGKIEVKPVATVLPYHFWLGMKT
jgi:hypothetical protein